MTGLKTAPGSSFVTFADVSNTARSVDAGDASGSDDTATLTAKLATAGVGGTVDLRPGQTYIVGDLTLLGQQRLRSSGSLTTLQAKAGATYVVKCFGVTDTALDNIVVDGNAKASKGVLLQGSGSASVQRHLGVRTRIRNCSVGVEVIDGTITQADKVTWLNCLIHDCTTGYVDEATNGQNHLWLGGSMDNNTTSLKLGGSASFTGIGGQFQGYTTAVKFSGPLLAVKFIDWIWESNDAAGVDIDGSTNWPQQHVTLDNCVLQGLAATVKMGVGGSVLRSNFTRYNNGGIIVTAADCVFHDEHSSFFFGAAWYDTGSTGATPRRFKWDINGLELSSAPNATTLTVAKGKIQLAGPNANLGAMSGDFPYSQAVDLPSQGANSTTEINIAAASINLAVGDLCMFIGAPGLNHGLEITGLPVTTANNLRLRLANHTAGAIDAASMTMYFRIVRF